MSIYDGTLGEAEYAHGRDVGAHAAEGWRDGNWPAWATVGEDIGRAEVDYAQSYRTRAYWLGWLRGFRQVSR